MAILLLPFADSLFHFIPEKENKENRALKTKPKFDINRLDPFPQAYDEYYSDNFDLRNQFISINSELMFKIFNKPPVSGKAFMGNNGWMFITRHQMAMYTGKTLASPKELMRYYKIIKYRKHILDSIGCKYYFVIAPTKTSIYPEYLPLSKRLSNQKTLTDQLVSLLDTIKGVHLIDLRPVVRNAKGGIRLFRKTDNHWNDYGGFVAYQKIMQTLRKDFPQLSPPKNISEFKIDSTKVKGLALTNMMGIYDGIYENKITIKPTFKRKSKVGKEAKYPIPKGFGYPTDFEMVYETNNDSLPNILVIRDSFGNMIMPFMREHFNKSVFIFDAWHHEFNKNIVLNEKPDIYMQFILEMFIPNIPKHTLEPKL